MNKCLCGRFNERNTIYCIDCGRSLGHSRCLNDRCPIRDSNNLRYDPNGAINPVGAKFCRHCRSTKLSEGTLVTSFALLPPFIGLVVISAIFFGLHSLGVFSADHQTALVAKESLLQIGALLFSKIVTGGLILMIIYAMVPPSIKQLILAFIGLIGRVLQGFFQTIVTVTLALLTPPGRR